MAEEKKLLPGELEGEDLIVTLTDLESGEEVEFEIYAKETIDDQVYYAMLRADKSEEEYVILKASEDGDDLLFETVDDDEEFEKVEAYFNDLLFGEVNYDEN